MSFLLSATIAVNLLALMLTIWLGLYLVSRSPRYIIAWLTALALWSSAAMFLNTLLAINPPPGTLLLPEWLRFILPFLPLEDFTGVNNGWLQGWSVAPALALWHHVSILLLPGRTTTWRWVRILVGYLLAVIAIIVQNNAPIISNAPPVNPLYLNSLLAGPWYPIFTVSLVILTWATILNLAFAAYRAPSRTARKQLRVLAWATLAGGLAGFVSIPGSYFQVRVPILIISLLEAMMVAIIGWGVARYSALVEGRIIQKDFLYSLSLLGFVLLIYIPISWVLIDTYKAPMVILAVFPALAVVTHSSMTAIDRLRDRIVYTHETRQLRIQLRKLSRQVGVAAPLEVLLEPSLETLCNSVEACYGLIVVFEDHTTRKLISWQLDDDLPDLALDKLTADDAVNLPPKRFPAPLEKASLLVPLYGEVEQLGALVLGEPENGLQYAPEDLHPILEFADQVGETIQISQQNTQYLAKITELVEAHTIPHPRTSLPVSAVSLELALRNLYDFAYLADCPLAELMLVQSRLAEGQVTHLERGKAVHAVLFAALEELRPGIAMPPNPPPREWYPYIILKEAYIEETSNRDIMQKLYISEGTFNRTRRTAIRSLARAIGEMEASIP